MCGSLKHKHFSAHHIDLSTWQNIYQIVNQINRRVVEYHYKAKISENET